MNFKDLIHALSIAWRVAKQDSSEKIETYAKEIKKLIITPEISKDVIQKLDEYEVYLENKNISAEDFDRLMYICQEFLIFQNTLEDTTKHKSFINEVLPKLSSLNDVSIAYPLTMNDDEFEFYKTDEGGTWLTNSRVPSILKYTNDDKSVKPSYFYGDGIILQERYSITEESAGKYNFTDKYDYFNDQLPINIEDYWNNSNKEVFTVKDDGSIGSVNILAIIKNTSTFNPQVRNITPCYSVQLLDDINTIMVVDEQALKNIKAYNITKYSDKKTKSMLAEQLKTDDNIKALREIAMKIRESNPVTKEESKTKSTVIIQK